jgi:hypothetical protein
VSGVAAVDRPVSPSALALCPALFGPTAGVPLGPTAGVPLGPVISRSQKPVPRRLRIVSRAGALTRRRRARQADIGLDRWRVRRTQQRRREPHRQQARGDHGCTASGLAPSNLSPHA